MKKISMETLVAFIDTNKIDELAEIRNELVAELSKGKEKADANRALYDQIKNAVVEVLASATVPVTAQELANETGFPKGKIVYGLSNYWTDLVEKTEGKVNTYSLKEKA